MPEILSISCIIPVYNEEESIEELITSLEQQTLPPAEIIFVDGGSTDNTVEILKQKVENNSKFRVITVKRAMPGEGRNIGAAAATNEWIVFTDAGIRLKSDWLEKLVAAIKYPQAGIVYGNFSPIINGLFEKCAAISYVPPLKPGAIRTKFIASCLLRKEIWEKAGGFPNWRAAEDLYFIERAEGMGFQIVYAPDAMVYWRLRQNLFSTYSRFDLYSKYNVWAGRERYWHYGLLRQYIFILLSLLFSLFWHWQIIFIIPLWLMARSFKRIYLHRFEFGIKELFNPVTYAGVIIITITIDLATFSGWIKALLTKPPAGFSLQKEVNKG